MNAWFHRSRSCSGVAGEADRLDGEIPALQVGSGRRRVTLVEDQVEHVQDDAQAVGALRLRGQAEWDTACLDLVLGAADALGDRRLRDEQRARDLGGRQSADRAKREGELGGRRQRGMRAQEEQGEGVVLVGRELVARGRCKQLVGRCPRRRGLLAAASCLSAAQLVRQAASRHREQPRSRISRDALLGPLEGRGEECLLDGVLAEVEAPVAADEWAEDVWRETAQQAVDFCSRRHISVPASSMIGRTSTAQKRAAGSWATISVARSRLSVSST